MQRVSVAGASEVSCLNEEDVLAFALGRLQDQALSAVEGHIDGCRNCRLMISVFAGQSGGETNRRAGMSAFGAGDLLAGRYGIVELLGRGGMGEVYAARDAVLGETVALKTIAVGSGATERHVTRLKAEVQLARRITHRNVCRVFDVGFHVDEPPGGERGAAAQSSIPFFTMELLHGETLRARIRRLGPRPEAEVVEIVEQMAAAIDAAHEAAVIHTDLKSDNVMLVPDASRSWRIVITDFGLARPLDERSLAQGNSGDIAGTFGYMAPEQLAGRQTGPTTDIYALGVVLFEMLTGHLPVRPRTSVASAGDGPAATRTIATAASPTSVIHRTETMRSPIDRWQAPGAAFRALPPGWKPIVRRCLAAEPADRFASARDVVAAVRERQGRPPIIARRRVARVLAAVAIAAIAAGGTMAVVRSTVGRSRAAALHERDPQAPLLPPETRATATAAPAAPATTVPVTEQPIPAAPPRPIRVARPAKGRPRTNAIRATAIRPEPSPPEKEAPPATVGADDDEFIDPFPTPPRAAAASR